MAHHPRPFPPPPILASAPQSAGSPAPTTCCSHVLMVGGIWGWHQQWVQTGPVPSSEQGEVEEPSEAIGVSTRLQQQVQATSLTLAVGADGASRQQVQTSAAGVSTRWDHCMWEQKWLTPMTVIDALPWSGASIYLLHHTTVAYAHHVSRAPPWWSVHVIVAGCSVV